MVTQKERVEVLNPVFPGYDAPLDSKVQRPQRYGVTYTHAARALLNGVSGSRQKIYYLSTRMSKERETQLREALKVKEPADWLREQIDRVIKRAARLREQANGKGLTNTNSLSEREEFVK
jgi:hypothetical protein